jgi:hypothetical protein
MVFVSSSAEQFISFGRYCGGMPLTYSLTDGLVILGFETVPLDDVAGRPEPDRVLD